MRDYSPPQFVTTLTSWKIGQLGNFARNAVSEALAAEKVRRNHATVLAKLSESGPMSQAELSRSLWIDQSDLHAVLNDLERMSAIARVQDPADRRRNSIELRPAGEQIFARLTASLTAAQSEILAPLDASERKNFVAQLDKLIAHHEAEWRAREGD